MLARPAGKRSAQTLRGCLCHVAGATRISVCIDSLKVSCFGETVSVSSSSETFIFASVLGASITLDSACKWKCACSCSPCALDTETEPHRPGAKQKFVSHPLEAGKAKIKGRLFQFLVSLSSWLVEGHILALSCVSSLFCLERVSGGFSSYKVTSLVGLGPHPYGFTKS